MNSVELDPDLVERLPENILGAGATAEQQRHWFLVEPVLKGDGFDFLGRFAKVSDRGVAFEDDFFALVRVDGRPDWGVDGFSYQIILKIKIRNNSKNLQN